MHRETSKTMDIFCYTVFALILAARICNADEDFDTSPKRAVGNVGLFPFPRVGRSDPDVNEWDSYNSFENYDDLGRHEMKRQGLVAFPRVGRSGGFNSRLYQQLAENNKRGMPTSNSAAGHMWFGPRLGRKRSSDQENEVFTPRLGRSGEGNSLMQEKPNLNLRTPHQQYEHDY